MVPELGGLPFEAVDDDHTISPGSVIYYQYICAGGDCDIKLRLTRLFSSTSTRHRGRPRSQKGYVNAETHT